MNREQQQAMWARRKNFEQSRLLEQYHNLPKGNWQDKNSLSVTDGKRIGQYHVRWYAHMIDDPKKKIAFVKEATNLINNSTRTAKNGYDVERGTSIEQIFYKHKYNDKDGSKHREYCRSMD